MKMHIPRSAVLTIALACVWGAWRLSLTPSAAEQLLSGGPRVILIGEPTHGGGRSVLTRLEITVELLNSMSMQPVTIAVEASAEAGQAIDDFIQGRGISLSEVHAANEMWFYHTEEYATAWRRLRELNQSRELGTKISVVGIDCQYPSRVARRLNEYCETAGLTRSRVMVTLRLLSGTNFAQLQDFADLPDGEREAHLELLAQLDAYARSPQVTSDLHRLRQAAALLGVSDTASYNEVRNDYLATNLHSHMESGHYRAAIVWCHNMHAIRGGSRRRTKELGDLLSERMPGLVRSVSLVIDKGSVNIIGFPVHPGLVTLRDSALLANATGIGTAVIVDAEPVEHENAEQLGAELGQLRVHPAQLSRMISIGWFGTAIMSAQTACEIDVSVPGDYDAFVRVGEEAPSSVLASGHALVNQRIADGQSRARR